ncbi:hypothetical protein GCM10027395_13370 [Giesbergeria sinuosa]
MSEGFAVHHVILSSLWENNDLWNLVPTNPRVNPNKFDAPTARELLWERQPILILG